MKSTLNLYYQLKATLPLMFALYLPTLFVLCILVVIRLETGIPISFFTRDTSEVVHAPLYAGVLSKSGILIWCSTAAICLFSAAVLHKEADKKELTLFFLYSGLMTFMLLLDDFFLFHTLFPTYLHIPKILVYTGYGIMISYYLMRFWTMIVKSEFLLIIFALGFFGLSIIIDIGPEHYSGKDLLEDGFKLLGIVSWATYFIKTSLTQIRLPE